MRTALLPLAFVLAVGATACRRADTPGPFRGAPVILISIDTLRADHLPAYGYTAVATPAFDALAGDSMLFENAYCHYPLTLPSHVSLLSGLLPPRHGVRDNSGYSFDGSRTSSLPTLLKSAGYATGGFVSTFVLRAETGLGPSFATYDSAIEIEPGAALDSGQREGLKTAALALQWVRAQGDRPFFLFLHIYEPHAPYEPPEPYRSRYAALLYDGEIATTDAVLGGVFTELKRLGIYQRAAIALVGDHGEALGEHGERQHGVFLYRATTHVPLLVKLPGQARAATRVTRPVGLVDVAPTLLQLVGVESPDDLDGRSLLLAPEAGEPERAIYAESYYPRLHFGWNDLKAVYESRWMYVEAPQSELYDLAADPRQEHDVLAAHRREFGRLRAQVAAIDRPLADPESVDAATAAQLASLGYLSSPSVRSSGPLPDPKSQRHLLAEIEAGLHAFGEKRYDDAVAHFRTTLEANDQMFDIWAFLARAEHAAGRDEQAVAAWERALELSGGSSEIALVVASSELRLKHLARARQLAEIARARDPKGADDLLAQIDLLEGRRSEAYARRESAASAGRATEGIAYKLALERLADGRPADAVALLAPFAEKGEAATLTAYGLSLSEIGRHDEALAVLARVDPQENGSAKLHEARGIVLLRLERPTEAKAELERALALDPRLADSWNTLGVALYQLQDPRGAMAAWKRAIALDEKQYDALFNLGLVAAQSGERTEARRALERFARSAPPDRFAADIERAKTALSKLGG